MTSVQRLITVSVLMCVAAARGDDSGGFYRFSTQAPLSLTSVEMISNALVLHFADCAGQPITPVLLVNGEAASIQLPLDPEPRRYDYSILIESGDDPPPMMTLMYFPGTFFSAQGNSTGAQLFIASADIPTLIPSVVTPRHYSDADLAWARKQWPSAASSDREIAETVAIQIMRALGGHTGVPSDKMGSTPRTMFERASSGVDSVWCDQLAQILHFALTSYAIPARVIHTGQPCQMVGDICFRTADGHTTLEYFSRQSNSWSWLDPTENVLSVTIDNGIPLNLDQFIHALGTPLEHQLSVRRYDAKSDRVGVIGASDDRLHDFTSMYLRPGVKLAF